MRTKAEVKTNVEKAISKGVDPNEILEYMEAEGYTYNDLASTSDKISAYIMKGLQGLTLGHADEIGGGLLSLAEGRPYQETRDQLRNAEKLFQLNNPVSSTTAEIGGGLLAGILGLGGKANTLWNLAKSGGLLGGAAGHGYSEAETAKGKLIDTGIGTVAGTGMGLATKPVVDVGKSLVNFARKPILNYVNKAHPDKPYRAVIRDIEADGLTVDDVMRRLDEMGGESIIPDAAGGNITALAKHVAETPGKGVDVAQRVLTNRDLGQGGRLTDVAAKLMGKTRNYYDELDDLFLKRQADSSALYSQFVDDPAKTVDMGKLAQLMKDEPYLQKVFEQIGKDPLNKLDGYPINSVRYIDTVKKSLQGKSDVMARAGNKFKAGNITDAKNKLVSMADEALPEYAEARRAYEIPSRQMDAMEEGRKFMRGDSELVTKQVKAMDDDTREYFLSGVIRQIDDTIMSAPDNADMAKRIFGSQKKRNAIKAAFNDDEKFKAFEEAINIEFIMNRTKQRILGGSPTYKNLAKAEQAKGAMTDFLFGVAQNNPLDATHSLARGALRSLNQGFSPQELETLTDILFTQNNSIMNTGLRRELLKRQGLLDLSDTATQLLNSGLLGYQSTQLQPQIQGALKRYQ